MRLVFLVRIRGRKLSVLILTVSKKAVYETAGILMFHCFETTSLSPYVTVPL